jgi:hypothetical protein
MKGIILENGGSKIEIFMPTSSSTPIFSVFSILVFFFFNYTVDQQIESNWLSILQLKDLIDEKQV